MPQPPENDAGLTAPRPEVFLRDLNLGVYKRVWWPIPVAMRPKLNVTQPRGGADCHSASMMMN